MTAPPGPRRTAATIHAGSGADASIRGSRGQSPPPARCAPILRPPSPRRRLAPRASLSGICWCSPSRSMPSPLDLRARLVAVGYPGGRARVAQGVNLYGRPESRTTMRYWLRETTSVIVAGQEPPRLSVMLIGVPRGSSASAATSGPSSTAPQPSSSLQGLQPAKGGLSLRRLEVGREFAVECRRDDVTSPGADVDVPFIAKPREAVAEFGFDADLETSAHRMT